MGVITVAVFKEDKPKPRLYKKKECVESKATSSANRSFESDSTANHAKIEAGTGFGEHASSHSYRVHFNPKRATQSKYFYKYGWRGVLYQRQNIYCGHYKHKGNNRFWPHDEVEVSYALYPPHHR